MSDQLAYHSPTELQALSLEELRALWELVPTDRQRSYRAAYDREVLNAGAVGSDVLEAQVAAELLRRYDDDALVPVGARWARTPERVQVAARDNQQLDDPTVETAHTPSSRLLIGGGIAVLLLVGLLTFRLFGGGGNNEVAIVGTATVTPTPTLEFSPTPTPLAIEIQDDVIGGGDAARSAAYPVNLQVRDHTGAPHVWVVQRRGVKAAEWNYDPSPDIASFVNGMSVRPVIGIPYSEDNAALFNAMDDGTDFTLTMNTGAILRFAFATKTEVLRSDTRIFRQVGPGLVLLLIGETDDDGLPTGTRTLITATYPPEQELSRGGELVGLSSAIQEGETGSTLELGVAAAITLRNVSTVEDDTTGQQALLFDMAVMDAAAYGGYDRAAEWCEMLGWKKIKRDCPVCCMFTIRGERGHDTQYGIYRHTIRNFVRIKHSKDIESATVN